ncbi:Eco57I restriction-modification methylase domain-containing protein [Sulfurovum sp. NBC37-1]|uniref:Eco57I restriction-modification methylase domain-containing protein n=1 Tax=Sulfurovum sp. (strain NBC37-1) TaxID=387093 RepID=UPI0001587D3A|nr:N-6 DNA methylase [Sulfurovum sp. NBC37-1]BAF73174.1 hypothetical protein SUN_2234 [Sulfurovum sp. NBC37-1]
MSLFQNSVLRNYLRNMDTASVSKAYETYKQEFLSKIANIKTSKEEQYQYGFLDDLFVKVLGYTLNPSPGYDLIAEQKNVSDSKKADGAILKDGKVIAVIELKSTKTKSMDKIVDQAFNYKNNHPACKYIITSNFEKLRFYVEYSDRYEEFNLFMLDEERFGLFYYLLNKEKLFADIPLKLKQDSKLQEESISNELYKKYAGLRLNLFENIIENNPQTDRHLLLEKTQTILDRMVFIFFAEDRGILPPNTIQSIIDHYKGDIEDRDLWHFYKIYFKAINQGNKKLNIPEYNGGLFAADEVLESLKIDNHVIDACPLALSAYDFNTDIDVNILGHIFENSLNDIEELKARINDTDFDASKSKRKKDGVFYTPEYITRYIVDNTLGKLCQAKKEALGLDDVEIEVPKNPKKLNKTETKLKEALEAYREYLLGLKILDPACGSGAFLNQALNHLLEEHDFIDEGIRTLMGGSVLGLYDVKKGILENNLYGVDINAEAVEIAKLSLWLRTVESGRKLNKLADKIKVGNSLIDDKSVAEDAFVWEEEFPEVFGADASASEKELQKGEAEASLPRGGFDVVIGNPPYVRQELLSAEDKDFFKNHYQTYHGTADLYVYFYEKAFSLLKENGHMSYISSSSYFKSGSGANLRKYLKYNTVIEKLIDFGDDTVFEEATTYPVIFIGRKNNEDNNYISTYIKDSSDMQEIEQYSKGKMHQSRLNDNRWQLADESILKLYDKIKSNKFTLKEYIKNDIFRGVLTGLNEAFVIRKEIRDRLIVEDIRNAEILKPFFAGQDLGRYKTPVADKYLLLFPKGWTREQSGLTDESDAWNWLKDHNPSLYSWLEPFAEKGRKRYDKGEFWWELRACDYYEVFEKPKIFYPDMSQGPKFCLDLSGSYSTNTTYLIPGDDLFLLGILNSKLCWFYLKSICEALRGGQWRLRLFTQNIEQIPVAEFTNVVKKKIMEEYVEKIIKLNQLLETKKHKFLNRLTDNYDLDKPSKKLEAFYELDFKTFLKELKKKKITLTLKEQDEWEEYFNEHKTELLELQRQIDNTDKEIDKMVYELYGLTEEEIAVVEGND